MSRKHSKNFKFVLTCPRCGKVYVRQLPISYRLWYTYLNHIIDDRLCSECDYPVIEF